MQGTLQLKYSSCRTPEFKFSNFNYTAPSPQVSTTITNRGKPGRITLLSDQPSFAIHPGSLDEEDRRGPPGSLIIGGGVGDRGGPGRKWRSTRRIAETTRASLLPRLDDSPLVCRRGRTAPESSRSVAILWRAFEALQPAFHQHAVLPRSPNSPHIHGDGHP